VLLEYWPSGMKFVFVDDNWGRGGKNDWLVAPEKSAKGQQVRKRLGSKADYGHERKYVRLSLNTHSAHKLILNTGLGVPGIRSARIGSGDGTYRRFRVRELVELIPVFVCRKGYLADRRARTKMWRDEGRNKRAYAVQHAVFFARLPEIDGALADKVVVRIWRNTR